MKADVAAGTKLQLWQEIMRQYRCDESGKQVAIDPIAAAVTAEKIFDKLCGPKVAARKR